MYTISAVFLLVLYVHIHVDCFLRLLVAEWHWILPLDRRYLCTLGCRGTCVLTFDALVVNLSYDECWLTHVFGSLSLLLMKSINLSHKFCVGYKNSPNLFLPTLWWCYTTCADLEGGGVQTPPSPLNFKVL